MAKQHDIGPHASNAAVEDGPNELREVPERRFYDLSWLFSRRRRTRVTTSRAAPGMDEDALRHWQYYGT